MATAKKSGSTKKKRSNVQVRDIKPGKDAKGGAAQKFSSLGTSKISADASKIYY